jgi:hypothetical protein
LSPPLNPLEVKISEQKQCGSNVTGGGGRGDWDIDSSTPEWIHWNALKCIGNSILWQNTTWQNIQPSTLTTTGKNECM